MNPKDVKFNKFGKIEFYCPLCKRKTTKEELNNLGCCSECDNKEQQTYSK